MAQIRVQIGDFEQTFDITTDPLHILLTAENAHEEADAHEATLMAGQAVTKPKSSSIESE